MRLRQGLTLVETMLSLVLFGLLSVALSRAVVEASKIWRRSTGESSARLALRQTQRRLSTDLGASSFAQTATAPGLVQLASAGRNGDIVWCLSALDPVSGNYIRKDNGSPFFQCNVLYYLSVPSQHNQLYGSVCNGFNGPGGYDVGCPHKMLLRKVIDFATPTLLTDETTEETLMTAADLAAYLTQPATLSTASMLAEPGVRSVNLVTPALLNLRVTRSATAGFQSLDVDASSLSLLEAKRTIAVGSVDLDDTAFTSHLKFSPAPGLP